MQQPSETAAFDKLLSRLALTLGNVEAVLADAERAANGGAISDAEFVQLFKVYAERVLRSIHANVKRNSDRSEVETGTKPPSSQAH
jgi:hypothetical protein